MSDKSFVPSLPPGLETVNGVDQITTKVAGFDERQAYSKAKTDYFIGQFYTDENNTVDYDNYFLYSGNDIQWTASEQINPLWNDIRFEDVRKADSTYENHTEQQQENIDWVRGLAIQLGYYSLFCIDEPFWVCASIVPSIQDEEDPYLDSFIDEELDLVPVNTYESALINSSGEPFQGTRQKFDAALLK